MNKKKNIESIDLLKGIGIILVVVGHCKLSFAPTLNHWIYAFHMPLFAFIGGLFFRMESFKDFIMKRAKRLLIPFYIWSMFFWLLYSVIVYFSMPALMGVQIRKIIYIIGGSGQNAIDQYANVTLWFLPFLFTVSIIHFFIFAYFKKHLVEYLGVILVGISGVLCYELDLKLPYKINTALSLYPFFWVGSKYLSEIKSRTDNFANWSNGWYLILVFGFIYLVSTYLNGFVDTASNYLGIPLFFYISAFSAIAALCIVTHIIKKINWINYLGRNSIIILIFHLPIILLLKNISLFDLNFISCIYIDMIPVFTILLSVPVIYVVNKFCPFLIGIYKSESKR